MVDEDLLPTLRRPTFSTAILFSDTTSSRHRDNVLKIPDFRTSQRHEATGHPPPKDVTIVILLKPENRDQNISSRKIQSLLCFSVARWRWRTTPPVCYLRSCRKKWVLRCSSFFPEDSAINSLSILNTDIMFLLSLI